MKFRIEVQKQFQKAGWYKGRNVKEKFDSIPRFNEYPNFLKEFLYEYGDLEIETLTEYSKGLLNLRAIPSRLYNIQFCIDTPRYFGNIIAYPLADYHLDSASLLCDADGNVYMNGDFPTLISKDFKTGIEKVIMEDYSDTLEWNPITKEWVDEY